MTRLQPQPQKSSPHVAPLLAFFLTFSLLSLIQLFAPIKVLLAERFFSGLGYLEAILLATYAAILTHAIADERKSAMWRRRLWTFFSMAFFAQLLLGLLGLTDFLMTGALHLPVPAMIVGGPIYRGGGLFMPILFLATTLLAGPAWCSYLCYIGAFDLQASRSTKRPKPLPHWRRWSQIAMLFLVSLSALLLRLTGAPPYLATALGLAFGLVGVALMLTWSRKTGQMTHCTAFCPIGFLATFIGRLSPWRIRIASGCDDCGACIPSCRYDALRPEHIASRRPGPSCTLCGDCLRVCKRRFIEYRLFSLSPKTARLAFVVWIVTLHAVFLGVARI